MQKKEVPEVTESPERQSTYTVDQIMQSERYRDKRDVVSVVLVGGNAYQLKEVDVLIEKFMKGKVK